MKNKIFLTFFILVVIIPLACQNKSLEKDMVQFDKSLMPVMYYTWQGDLYSAKNAVFALDFQWQKFRNRYQTAAKQNEEWEDALHHVNVWLGDAYYSIDNNDAALAGIQLDHASYELRALRAIHHMDYYLDYLYNFQDDMAWLIEVAEDEMLCLYEWEEFVGFYEEALDSWVLLEEQQPDNQLFELTNKQLSQLTQQSRLVANSMKELSQIMPCANRLAILQAAQQVENDLMIRFKILGNFEATKIHYANQQ